MIRKDFAVTALWDVNLQDAKDTQEELDRLSTTHSKELKPCPFCGGEAELDHTWTLSWWIECQWCGIQLHDPEAPGGDGTLEQHEASMVRAKNAWNTRLKIRI